MQFAALGVNLRYRLDELRDGAALVFIHSLGCDLRIWDDVVPHFAQRFRIVRYDLRGHGLSDCRPAPYTISDHVADLVALLDHLRVETAILIGISVGGMIAMDYAAARPEQVKTLILCDTNTTIGTTAMWNERIETLRQKGMESMAEPIMARWLAPSFRAQHPAVYRGYYKLLTRRPVTGYTATCEAIRDADLTEAARMIKAKTLVETLANGRFAVVEGAGHLPCIKQSDKLVALIGAFLEELEHVG